VESTKKEGEEGEESQNPAITEKMHWDRKRGGKKSGGGRSVFSEVSRERKLCTILLTWGMGRKK